MPDRCDYAMHIKVYGANQDGERRYSPAEVISSEKVPVMGTPEKKRICTSHIERPKPHHPYADAPHDAPYQCLQQEVGQLVERLLPVVRVLQLLPGSPDLARHPCDGSGPCEPDMEIGGPAGIDTGSIPALRWGERESSRTRTL